MINMIGGARDDFEQFSSTLDYLGLDCTKCK